MQARLPESIDVPSVITKGMEILEKAGELHTLATKYLEYVKQWQSRLQNITAHRLNGATKQNDGLASLLANGQNVENIGQTVSEALTAQLPANQFALDVGTGFFDIENLFDPSTWFDMSYNWNETQPVR